MERRVDAAVLELRNEGKVYVHLKKRSRSIHRGISTLGRAATLEGFLQDVALTIAMPYGNFAGLPPPGRRLAVGQLLDYYAEDPAGHEMEHLLALWNAWKDKDSARESTKLSTFAQAYGGTHHTVHDSVIITPKEPTMSIITVKTQVLVNGKPLDQISQDEAFGFIRDSEKQIAELEAIASKPKALTKRIEKLREGIAALVTALDAKEE
jgi:hypothetical protein